MSARPEYNIERPFVATATGGLVYDGRRYKQGEPFPWRKLGLSEEQLWDLWVTFQIDNAPTCPAIPAQQAQQRQPRK